MVTVTAFNLGGINLYTNPLIHSFENQVTSEDGQIIRAVNVISAPHGAKMKRPGYGTAIGSLAVGTGAQSLFSWTQDNGTTLNVYAAAGSLLYYSAQGTGAWSICGGGTITPGSQVGYAVLNNTLTISQNNGTTRNSTNGTSFSDTSGAPAGGALEVYQNKVFLTGTSNVVSASVTGDPTNWATTGTSDGYTFTIGGAGLPIKLFKLDNRLFTAKNYGQILQWDGQFLVDLSTGMGPSSPYSYGSVEDSGFWINRFGVYTSNGGQPDLISNPITRYFYNQTGTAIAGTSFNTVPATFHQYDYYAAVGSMTDDLTFETVPNAIIRYSVLKNEFLNYSFSDFPVSFHSYKDATGSVQMIFSNAQGNIFQYGNQQTSDNGQPIESIVEMVFHMNAPHLQKDWRNFWAFFNPGCQAQVLIAYSDTFLKEEKNWIVIGQGNTGIVYYRFPASSPGLPGSRSRLLYVKIIESSRNSRFDLYGVAIDGDIVPIQ